MKQSQIKKQFETGRLAVSRSELYQHYGSVLVILFMPAVMILDKVSEGTLWDQTPVAELILVELALFIFYLQYQALRFKIRWVMRKKRI
ncbi:MAG: hypothetical protein R2824_21520 [Saprospiraceae bacterium]|nr:hypothetical protein [Lewinella sp.]